MNNRGVVLIVSTILITVLVIITGVFFFSSVNEKKSSDKERYFLQALSLAEAGAYHGVSELRRLDSVLNVNVENEPKNSTKFSTYFNSCDPCNPSTCNPQSLAFFREFALGESNPASDTSPVEIDVTPLSLDTGIKGNYQCCIRITKNTNYNYADDCPLATDTYIFPFRYEVVATGAVTATTPSTSKQVTLTDGEFDIKVSRANFAKFALFTFHHSTPSGIKVWFTDKTNFTGPVSTNERFNFALNPSASFTEEVTQHFKRARFYNNGRPIKIDADSNPPYDVPTFDKGFERDYDLIELEPSISQTELKRQAYGGTGDPGANGIYLPNDGTSCGPGLTASLTGGVFIDGDGTVSLGISTSGNPQYTITQGGTTRVIEVDYGDLSDPSDDRTIADMDDDGIDEIYCGLPDGIDDEGILIYDDGDITSLGGVVEQNTNITVSSERDIIITDNIMYQNYNPGPPPDAIGATNLLGVLSWGGDVRIGLSAPDDINIHGVIMAHGTQGEFTVDNYWVPPARGTCTLLGGVISQFYGAFGTFWGDTQLSGYGRNWVYDARMLQGNAPPYFPILTNFTSFDTGLDQPLIWKED